MPPPKNLKHSDVKQFFSLPLKDAAKKLSVSETMLKKYCRRNGILNWPFRVFRTIDAVIQSLRNSNATQDQNEQSTCVHLLISNREYLADNVTLVPLLTQGNLHFTSDLRAHMQYFHEIQASMPKFRGPAPSPAILAALAITQNYRSAPEPSTVLPSTPTLATSQPTAPPSEVGFRAFQRPTSPTSYAKTSSVSESSGADGEVAGPQKRTMSISNLVNVKRDQSPDDDARLLLGVVSHMHQSKVESC